MTITKNTAHATPLARCLRDQTDKYRLVNHAPKSQTRSKPALVRQGVPSPTPHLIQQGDRLRDQAVFLPKTEFHVDTTILLITTGNKMCHPSPNRSAVVV